jgi:hypothetical protein
LSDKTLEKFNCVSSIRPQLTEEALDYSPEVRTLRFNKGQGRSPAAISLAITTGAIRTKTIVLLKPEEVDQAIKIPVEYHPPGSSA